jgi:hypothetical protein
VHEGRGQESLQEKGFNCRFLADGSEMLPLHLITRVRQMMGGCHRPNISYLGAYLRENVIRLQIGSLIVTNLFQKETSRCKKNLCWDCQA